ncbi:MAG: PqqD family protein [Methanomassiliicoccales archaeon]|nr:MAG: PqqD family protein [Methanomassiliicoccales archaeon]
MEIDELDPKMKMLLTCIPKRNEEVEWVEEDDRVVLIYPKNFTRFERFLHRHIGGPENIRRPLDDKGAFIWKMCDGDHNVHEICRDTYSEFKEDIEPVIRRVWGFLETLLKLNLITMNVPEKEKGKDEDKGDKDDEDKG